MNIKLHIDRLILEGLPVDATDSKVVRGAVESELTRLLASGGLSAEIRRGALPNLRVIDFQFSTESRPSQLGKKIAQSLYGGIGK